MSLSRLFRHLFATRWASTRAFPQAALKAIEAAVGDAERGHAGQIRVVIEGALPAAAVWRRISARQRAVDIFSLLRVWDTEHNNGVLIYLLLADRDVEIIADRGIARRVDQSEWEVVCRQMESAFRAGRYEEGIIAGIGAVAVRLTAHFPRTEGGANELPDKPLLL